MTGDETKTKKEIDSRAAGDDGQKLSTSEYEGIYR